MRGRVPAGGSRSRLHCLAALLAMLALASPGWATSSSGGWSKGSSHGGFGGWSGESFGGWFGGWPGISLADLVDGETFESLDGSLTFSDFEVDLNGSSLRRLNLYWVVPLEDGFKLVAPMGAAFGSHSELGLTYEVMANQQAGQGFLVEAMSMSILGITIGPGAELKAIAELFDPDNPGVPLLGDPLEVEADGLFGHGSGEESPLLTPLLEQVLVEELITATSGSGDMGMGGSGTGGKKKGKEKPPYEWGGFVAGTVVKHRFSTVTPEPATALMLGSGLLGLAALARRRQLGQSPPQ